MTGETMNNKFNEKAIIHAIEKYIDATYEQHYADGRRVTEYRDKRKATIEEYPYGKDMD